MRGVINDFIRWLIGLGFAALGPPLEMVHLAKICVFSWSQKRLRRRFGVTADSPILSYGVELEKCIQDAASQAGQEAMFALTSGSTARPKCILYTWGRLRSVSLSYLEVFVRCYRAFAIRRKSLYCFSSFGRDKSLTSMLLDEAGSPSFWSRFKRHTVCSVIQPCWPWWTATERPPCGFGFWPSPIPEFCIARIPQRFRLSWMSSRPTGTRAPDW